MSMEQGARLVIAFFICILLSSLTSCAHQSSEKLESLSAIKTNASDHRQYRELTLDNGLQVVLVSDSKTDMSGAFLTVGVGSYQDPIMHQGLAHYTEHMLFIASEKYPEPDSFRQFLGEVGGSVNGSTFSQLTDYRFLAPNSAFDESLDRFANMITAPLFDPEYSQKEISAVDNEWTSRYGHGVSRAIIGQLVDSSHPITKFMAGNSETLNRAEADKLHAAMKYFYRTYYSANLMRLVIYGRDGVDTLERKARQKFSQVQNSQIDRPMLAVDAFASMSGTREVHLKYDSKRNMMRLVFPIANNSADWRFKTNEYVASLIEKNQPGSLLYQLKKMNWVDDLTVVIESDALGNSGLVWINFILMGEGEKRRSDIIAATLGYFDFLKKNIEIEHAYEDLRWFAKNKSKGLHIKSPMEIMNQIAHNLWKVPYEYTLYEPYVFAGINKASVQHLLAQLNTNKLMVWHVGNEEIAEKPIPYQPGYFRVNSVDTGEIVKWAELQKQWNFSISQPNPWISRDAAPLAERHYFDATEIVAREGVEAYLMQDDNPYSSWGFTHLRLDSNLGELSAKNTVLAKILNNMLYSQNQELWKMAQDARLEIKLGLTPQQTQFIEIHGPTEHHPKLMDQLLRLFSQVQLNEQSFKREIKAYHQWFELLEQVPLPHQMVILAHNRVGNFRWSDEELLQELTVLQLDDLREYHEAIMKNHFTRIFSAGNYSPEMVSLMADSAREYFSLRQTGEVYPKQFIDFQKGLDLKIEKNSAQGDNAYSRVYISSNISMQELVCFELISGLMASEIFTRLRTHEEMAYFVASHKVDINGHAGIAMAIQSNSTELDRLSHRLDQFEHEFFTVLNNQSQGWLQKRIADLITTLEKEPDELWGAVQWQFQDWQVSNYPFDTKERLVDELKKLEISDLIEVYQAVVLQKQSTKLEVKIKGKRFQ